MSLYLVQLAYTTEAWQTLLRNPQDRFEAVRPAIEKLGGKMLHGWVAFGDFDVIGVFDMPSNIAAAAIAMAFAAGGAVKTVKTTPMLSVAEAVEAMRAAGTSGYRPASAGAAARS